MMMDLQVDAGGDGGASRLSPVFLYHFFMFFLSKQQVLQV